MSGFKPYGTPPPFNFDEFKDTFDIWKRKWNIFLALSTVDSALPEAERPKHKAQTLLSSTTTLQAVLSMGLTETQLENSKEIIMTLRNRCNAGRNCHVWRHRFASSTQRENQSVDDWLCELRDLARKIEFETDCCARCTPTRIIGQIVFRVHSNEVRVDLLKKGITLTLDEALATVRTAEASGHQAANLRKGETAEIQRVESTYKTHKFSYHKGKEKARLKDQKGPPRGGYFECGSSK